MSVETNDVVRATQEMHYESFGAIQNVYHLINIGVPVTDPQAVADVVELLEALAIIIKAIIAALQVVDGVRITNVTSIEDVGFGTFADPTPFTGTGTVSPTQVAGGLNLTTDLLSVIGRKYFGAAAAIMWGNGGILQSTALIDLALAGDYMTATRNATNTSWWFGVVASVDGVFYRFRNYSIPTMAIIQRRRRLGVGI